MELECQEGCGEGSAEPRGTGMARAILIVGAPDHYSDRIDALAKEFPQSVVLKTASVSAACQTASYPIALILIDSELHSVDAAVVLLRACHPAAHVAVMYPSVAAARNPAVSSRWSTLCRGLLPMDLSLEIWLAVVRLMLSGGEYFPAQPVDNAPPVSGGLAAQRRFDDHATERNQVRLTARELQILEKASQGMQNKLIAAEFSLSEHTVKVHLHNIISKLGVHNRTEAAARYHQLVETAQRRNQRDATV